MRLFTILTFASLYKFFTVLKDIEHEVLLIFVTFCVYIGLNLKD